MTKAEEKALEAYPVKQRYNDYYGDYEDMNIVERISFQEGYEQAEKDNVPIRNATIELIEAVEKYVLQETSRSTLIWKKEKLKRLLEK